MHATVADPDRPEVKTPLGGLLEDLQNLLEAQMKERRTTHSEWSGEGFARRIALRMVGDIMPLEARDMEVSARRDERLGQSHLFLRLGLVAGVHRTTTCRFLSRFVLCFLIYVERDGSILHQGTHTLVKGYWTPALIHLAVSVLRRVWAGVQ
ncbi:hypothetical protein B0G76_7464 [Paraburkholderia sp. BL23I1N1]|uniref:hypothetical protein n=1 Tax=Paraburkholderia sp. BL23I1N1 TaxID=1938802 RepID=UPI000E73AC0A|nr:hypothetical protein [Paraburkholderia sp. BL23I1N1]RKE25895.1 hypothetical protein B0G76_7464 [Paraburkholderia sp. BL23I1N1]